MDNDAQAQQEKIAKLATDFIRANPTKRNGIKTVDEFYDYVKSNPGEAEEFLKSQSGIEHPELQELAKAFQAAEHSAEMQKHQEGGGLDQGHSMGGHGAMSGEGIAVAGILAAIPKGEVKLAEEALSLPSPNVNLYEMVPTEILQNADYKNEITTLEKARFDELQAKNPKATKADIDQEIRNERDRIHMQALNIYGNSSERAEKIAVAREKDLYIKDANGRIVGEKVFRDKKGKADPSADPIYRSYQRQKLRAMKIAQAKQEANKKNKIKNTYRDDHLKQIINFQYDAHFAALFPEKAAAYSKVDKNLKHSLKIIKKAEGKIGNAEGTEAPQTSSGQTNKPTVNSLHRGWIKKTLDKAKEEGYKPFSALPPVWQERAKKAGLFATSSPAATATKKTGDKISQIQNKLKGSKEKSKILPQIENYNNQVAEWTSPRALSSKAWNRFASPRISNVNNRLGRVTKGNIKSNIQNKGKGVVKSAGNKILSQVESAGIQTLMKFPPFWVGVAVLIIGLIVVGFILLISSGDSGSPGSGTGGGPGGSAPPKNSNPIPNFSLQKQVSATTLPDDSTEITYTLSYSMLSSTVSLSTKSVNLSDITIHDTVPKDTTLVANKTTGNYTLSSDGGTISWALSDPVNAALPSVSFTVQPTNPNTTISNSAWGDAAVSSSPPGGGAQSPNTCTQPQEGTGYCSYTNLLPYFNNEPSVALTASIICNLESGSNPFEINPVCPDYSVGLFQINLVAHCGGAFSPAPACTVLDPTLKNKCEQRFLDPIENIKYAYQLYQSGGTGWTANKWSTYPKAQSILNACGSI